jgi:hypothetical protein
MPTDLRAIGPRFVLEEFSTNTLVGTGPGKTRLIDGAVLSDVSNVVLNGEANLDLQIAIPLGRLSSILPPGNKLMMISRVVHELAKFSQSRVSISNKSSSLSRPRLCSDCGYGTRVVPASAVKWWKGNLEIME